MNTKSIFIKKSLLPLCLIFCFALLLTGCAETTEETTETTEDSEGNGPAAEDEQTVTIKDHAGREIVVDGTAERIVSLSPSNTEVLFALGLDEKIVGVTDFCDYPPETADKDSVGNFTDPNLEKIITLEPDLVLGGSQHQEAITRMEERDIPALSLEPASLEQVYRAIEKIGAAAGAKAAAENLVSEMKLEIEDIQDKLQELKEEEKVPVYYELYYDPIMTAGNQSFIHEVVTLAGGENIFADLDDNYPTVSAEAVADRNPQVILYPEDHGSAKMIKEQFNERPGWREISAIQKNHIYAVNSDLFSRPGPRVTQAVQEAAILFYPELFEE